MMSEISAIKLFLKSIDCGNLVVKVTDSLLTWHEFERGAAEDPPYREGQCTLNTARLKHPFGDLAELTVLHMFFFSEIKLSTSGFGPRRAHTLGKKELIEWCMKERLIASSYECPECNDWHDVTWSTIKRFLRNRTSHAEGTYRVLICSRYGPSFTCISCPYLKKLRCGNVMLLEKALFWQKEKCSVDAAIVEVSGEKVRASSYEHAEVTFSDWLLLSKKDRSRWLSRSPLPKSSKSNPIENKKKNDNTNKKKQNKKRSRERSHTRKADKRVDEGGGGRATGFDIRAAPLLKFKGSVVEPR
ncbi:hypothetical protein TNCV_1085971 [Trichonephila clavipes]|nr:hypothetical protein TNCV_1085971 [Trichonephila clavipes]